MWFDLYYFYGSRLIKYKYVKSSHLLAHWVSKEHLKFTFQTFDIDEGRPLLPLLVTFILSEMGLALIPTWEWIWMIFGSFSAIVHCIVLFTIHRARHLHKDPFFKGPFFVIVLIQVLSLVLKIQYPRESMRFWNFLPWTSSTAFENIRLSITHLKRTITWLSGNGIGTTLSRIYFTWVTFT